MARRKDGCFHNQENRGTSKRVPPQKHVGGTSSLTEPGEPYGDLTGKLGLDPPRPLLRTQWSELSLLPSDAMCRCAKLWLSTRKVSRLRAVNSVTTMPPPAVSTPIPYGHDVAPSVSMINRTLTPMLAWPLTPIHATMRERSSIICLKMGKPFRRKQSIPTSAIHELRSVAGWVGRRAE